MMSLYNIEWQTLRVNLDFSSPTKITETFKKLDQYLLEEPKGYDTHDNKLWRILNLLNATRMGLNGQIKRFADNFDKVVQLDKMSGMVASYRDNIKEEYDSRKEKHFRWEEDEERNALSLANEDDLNKVYRSLRARRKFAKDYKKVKIEKTRPELLFYIWMLEREMERRGK